MDLAYRIAGEPEKVEFGERVVGIIESRDGTIMDVVVRLNHSDLKRKRIYSRSQYINKRREGRQ